MPIYMGVFDKPDVLDRTLRGDVTAAGYEGWIELSSAQLGSARSIKSNNSSGAERGPPVSEMQVTKAQDSASMALYRASIDGKPKLVVLAFVKDGTAYMTIVLRDTLISSYSIRGPKSEDSGMESFTLNFTQIAYNTKGRSPNASTWSLQQATGQLDRLGP